MTTDRIDGSLFNQMINIGAHHLMKAKDIINKLNVFPVPDGDTGTNMSLSMTSGVNEMKRINSERIFELSNAFAKGLLMGARGNSGVILSQLFRGFAESINEKETITIEEFAYALQAGVETAYKSVTNPVEGTILTVAKDVANYALHIYEDEVDFTSFLKKIVIEGKESLNRTPSLLPILQEVGVVDSGGKGLLTIYEGFLAAFTGEEVKYEDEELVNIDELIEKEHERSVQSYFNKESIEYGYCTEFIIELENDEFNEIHFRNELSEYGDSLLVATDDSVVKIHIHTETPGEVMTLAQRYGSLTNIDIDNMRKQYEEVIGREIKDVQPIERAIIAVASGSGIKEMLTSLGATTVVEGGQTMNPSTEDLLKAIEMTNAKQVIVLPNNKNIILAAEQATKLTDQHVIVIPTKSIQEGLSALFEYDSNLTIEENKDIMEEAIGEIKSGSITYATRDTVIGELSIKENEYIGLADDRIKVAHSNKLLAAEQLLAKLINENEDEILTVIFGADMTENEINEIEQRLEEKYRNFDIEYHRGNQGIYSLLFMIE